MAIRDYSETTPPILQLVLLVMTVRYKSDLTMIYTIGFTSHDSSLQIWYYHDYYLLCDLLSCIYPSREDAIRGCEGLALLLLPNALPSSFFDCAWCVQMNHVANPESRGAIDKQYEFLRAVALHSAGAKRKEYKMLHTDEINHCSSYTNTGLLRLMPRALRATTWW